MVLLAVVIGLGSVAKNIPLAVLAGILMKTGLDIIDLDFFKRIPKLPSSLTSVMVSSLYILAQEFSVGMQYPGQLNMNSSI